MRNVLFNLGDASIDGLLKSSLKVVHGLEDVENLLLANTETFVCSGLALWVFKFDRYI